MKQLGMVFSIILIWTFAQADNGDLEDPRVDSLLSRYNYQVPYTLDNIEQINSERKDCWVQDLNFTVDYPGNLNESFPVQARLYIPNPSQMTVEKIPMIIQLPPTSGVNTLDKFMAKDICYRNMASMVIMTDLTGFDDENLPPAEDHINAFQRAVSAIKGAQIFAEEHPQIDANKVALYGVSLGGILGSLAYSVEENLRAAYFLVAGGDVAFILANSTEDRVSRLRRLRMDAEDLPDRKAYEDYLRLYMDHDNMDLTGRILPETVRMIISDNDTYVPSENQFMLQRSMNDPEARLSKRGHVRTVINNMIFRSSRVTMINFFIDRFNIANPRVPTTQEFLQDLDVVSKH